MNNSRFEYRSVDFNAHNSSKLWNIVTFSFTNKNDYYHL